MKNIIIYSLGTVLILAGLYTFYSTTSILFDWFGGSSKGVIYIKLSQICSLICSFFYLVTGVLFFMKNKLATPLLFVATIVMFIGYIGMLFHINAGKDIDVSTIAEMLTRTTSTMLYAAVSWYIFTRTRFIYPPGHDAKSFKKLMKDYEIKKVKQRV